MTSAVRSDRAAPYAKGSVVRATLEFVRAELGAETSERVLARLAPELRARVERAEPTDEVPYADVRALWDAIEAVVTGSGGDGTWAERAGAFSIESTGVQLYGGILRKSSPGSFLTQSVSLFRLYYGPGDMEVVAEGPGSAVLRLVGFDAGTVSFCRRQTGGLRRAIALAGGADARTRHVRCALEGDAFCEWELSWRQ